MINVELRDVEQLHSLILMLEAESDVAAVARYRETPGTQARTI
jgi:GTP pyrophosphokinase